MKAKLTKQHEDKMKKEIIALKPVEKQSLYIKISDSIYSYMKVNDLQPGDKLPSERTMASMLQTSRNSVREALRILEDRGLIYIKTGSGVFVNNLYGDQNVFSVRLTDCTLEELQELQSALDHQAVLNAITRSTPEQKEKLVSIAADMMALFQDNIYSHTLDYSFHGQLYKMGKNNAIHQLINRIRDHRFVRREDADCENDSIWLTTVPDHFTLAKAIQSMNTPAALDAIDTINNHGFSLKLEKADESL